MTPTDQQVGELNRRLTRLEPLVRRRGSGGGMTWRGEWDASLPYATNDVVTHNGVAWVAPAAMPPGVEPGVSSDVLLYTVRGVRVHTSDRLADTNFVARTISASSDTTDISGRKAEPVLIDRTVADAHDIVIRNDHASAQLNAFVYDSANNYTGIAISALNPGATGTASIPGDSGDRIAIVYFTGSDAGAFAVRTTNVATLVPPPASVPDWEPMGSPGTGDLNYVHTQGTPSATWTVTHNLGKYVAVEVVDTGDSVVIPTVHYDSVNAVTLSFGSPTSGKAFVN